MKNFLQQFMCGREVVNMGKSFMKKRDGFTLIIVLLGLALMSILGIAIMGTTASNAKMTKVDGQSQGTYYIAEAGLNKAVYDMKEKVNELSQEQKTHDGFFDALDEYRDPAIPYGFEEILIGFENNFAETPKAEISISSGLVVKEEVIGKYSERVVRYDITCKGEIGKSNRNVTRSIDVSHKIETGVGQHAIFDYALYSKTALKLPNQSILKGHLYSRDIELTSAGSQIIGNITSETFVDIKGNGSHPKIEGNVYALNGQVIVSSGGLATVTGDVHAKGDVTIGSHGSVERNVYSYGDIKMLAGNAEVIGNIHAKNNVVMRHGAYVRNAYLGGNLQLYNSNTTVFENAFAGGNISKENETFINKISQAGGNVNQHNPANINIEIAAENKPIKPQFPIVDMVIPPDLTVFSPDTMNSISVPQSSSNYNIEPGTYGDLFVGGESTVTLKTGDYIFNSIDAGRWGQTLRLDLRDGPINIYSSGNIKYTGPVYVLSEKKPTWVRIDKLNEEDAIELAGRVYWETHGNFELNNDANPRQWFGTVMADENIKVGNPVTLIGAYVSRSGEINLGNNPTIIYAPPTDSAAGGSGGGDSAKGKNVTDEKDRVKATKIIEQ